jgi:tetratricopeptide (TPR) repeat protein
MTKSRFVLIGCALVAVFVVSVDAQSGTSAREYLSEGRATLQTAVGRFDADGVLAAADLFRRALEENARYAPAEIGLAEALIWLGDYGGARRALDRAAALRYPGRELQTLRARLLVLRGEIDAAEEIYSAILAEEPYHADAIVASTILSLSDGGGRVTYNRLVDLERRYPENLQLLVALIELSLRDGDQDAARRYLQPALRHHNDNAVVQPTAARISLAAGNPDEAIRFARNAVQLAPGYDAAWLLLAQATARVGRPREALTHYEQLIQLDPLDHRAWYARSILLAETGDTDDAVAGLSRALEIRPDYEIARIALEGIIEDATDLEDERRTHLARHYLSEGRVLQDRFLNRQAERMYRRGLQLDPFDPDLRIALAELYLDQGFRARYLQELEVLRSLGYTGYSIDDRIEAFRSLLTDSLAAEWEIDQFTARRPRTRVSLFVSQDRATIEPDAALYVGRYLSALLNTGQNIDVIDVDTQISARTTAIARARADDADWAIFIEVSLEETRIVADLEIVETNTAMSIAERVVPHSGLGRLDRTVRDLASIVSPLAPVRGSVVDRTHARALVTIGAVDGVSVDDVVALTTRTGPIGEARVTRVDDLVSEIEYRPDGPDLLGRGDSAVYLGPPQDEETEQNDQNDEQNPESTSLAPSSALPLVRSLFQLP